MLYSSLWFSLHHSVCWWSNVITLIARFMGPTWGPPGSDIAEWILTWERTSELKRVAQYQFCFIVTKPRLPTPTNSPQRPRQQPHPIHLPDFLNNSTYLSISYLNDANRIPFTHDAVIKWKHFPRYWPFVRGTHRSPVDSLAKASDAELCFLCSAPEQTVAQTIETPVIRDAIALIITSLQCQQLLVK